MGFTQHRFNARRDMVRQMAGRPYQIAAQYESHRSMRGIISYGQPIWACQGIFDTDSMPEKVSVGKWLIPPGQVNSY